MNYTLWSGPQIQLGNCYSIQGPLLDKTIYIFSLPLTYLEPNLFMKVKVNFSALLFSPIAFHPLFVETESYSLVKTTWNTICLYNLTGLCDSPAFYLSISSRVCCSMNHYTNLNISVILRWIDHDQSHLF